ncbi:MAG: FMN-binding negative transcriptional regulator [Rhodospirillaceae bacterium]|nr:FMN-binding negative transcriptional regulator [Rhodospirillaceae bacterium]MDD9916031.1 FMN-binding negative transcriptional regulator [Rhodospirillaceae bacterium]MDD9928610.1 FMN-binding negative transcriptional regulator [Rhodospirillaceae bacterium]
MYLPKDFAVEDREMLYGLIRANSFGLLISHVDGQPFATHLPFLLEGDVLVAHMARANPHWLAFADGGEVLCVFQGPHAYVSPSWYTVENAVPTWNYTAVHVYGTPEIVDDPQAAYADQDKLVDFNEAGFETPWRLGARDRDFVDGMIRAIVNFRIPIARIEGKFKLSQNRPEEDRERVAAQLEASADPAAAACGALMSARRDG